MAAAAGRCCRPPPHDDDGRRSIRGKVRLKATNQQAAAQKPRLLGPPRASAAAIAVLHHRTPSSHRLARALSFSATGVRFRHRPYAARRARVASSPRLLFSRAADTRRRPPSPRSASLELLARSSLAPRSLLLLARSSSSSARPHSARCCRIPHPRRKAREDDAKAASRLSRFVPRGTPRPRGASYIERAACDERGGGTPEYGGGSGPGRRPAATLRAAARAEVGRVERLRGRAAVARGPRTVTISLSRRRAGADGSSGRDAGARHLLHDTARPPAGGRAISETTHTSPLTRRTRHLL